MRFYYKVMMDVALPNCSKISSTLPQGSRPNSHFFKKVRIGAGQTLSPTVYKRCVLSHDDFCGRGGKSSTPSGTFHHLFRHPRQQVAVACSRWPFGRPFTTYTLFQRASETNSPIKLKQIARFPLKTNPTTLPREPSHWGSAPFSHRCKQHLAFAAATSPHDDTVCTHQRNQVARGAILDADRLHNLSGAKRLSCRAKFLPQKQEVPFGRRTNRQLLDINRQFPVFGRQSSMQPGHRIGSFRSILEANPQKAVLQIDVRATRGARDRRRG